MSHILGQHDVVIFGSRNNPRRLRFWAERGLIHVEDAVDNSYDTMPVKTFLHRLKAINDMVGNSKSETAKLGFMGFDEIERLQRFVEAGLDLARKAKEQGEPTNPDAVKASRQSRPATVVVPGDLTF